MKSMNYLFVMPRFVKNSGDSYIFPLGIAYVSASLKTVCNSVHCLNLNLNISGSVEEEVCDYIEKHDIDVLATGGLSPNYKQIKTIISTAKKRKPELITMLGGGILTATPEVLMRAIPELDIGMIAEGEETIQELYATLENNGDLDNVAGIIYRNNLGETKKTRPRPDIENLDALPFPDYDGFGFDGRGEISICTSRSCPYGCSFCFHTCGKKYRARSMDNIFKEIDWLTGKYSLEMLGILDELFSINNERMHEFCERIEPYKIKWSCQMRVDNMSKDILIEMKQAGCVSISFGIESADNRVLKSMEKHITIEKVESAIKVAREAGICPFGNLLLGEKADNLESFNKNLKWYTEHPDIRLGFNKILVLPGSKLYKYAVETGAIKDEVKYLEDEYYTINITQMSDEEYAQCVMIMDEAVAKRNYYLQDIEIEKYDSESDSYFGSGICPMCGEKISFKSRDFIGTQNGSCVNCGRVYAISLFAVFKGKMEEIIKNEWDNKKILLWGIGEEASKMIYNSNIIRGDNVFWGDRNVAKQHDMLGKKVIDPHTIMNDNQIDIVLIGTNAPVANNAIMKEIDEYSDNCKGYNLNEYLNFVAREHIANSL